MNISAATVRTEGGRTKVVIGDDRGAFDFSDELGKKIDASPARGADLTVGVRPEGVLVAHAASDGYVQVEAHIIEPLGAYDIVDLKVGGGLLRARTQSGFVAKPGDRVWAKLDESQTHFFNTQSGQSLNIRLGN